MASKSSQEANESAESVEEQLDAIDKNLERVKTLYEQYFLGIQKQPPTFIHTDLERKLRDLTQLQIRNTGMRYRLATLTQKLGAYNSYWKRTLRQIENGTYLRNLSKIGREAVRTGAEIPEEILAAMPKRMRDQVIRDREQALAIAKRRKLDETGGEGEVADEELLTLAPEPAPQAIKAPRGAHVVSEADADLDIDAFFAQVANEEAVEAVAPAKPQPAKPPQASPVVKAPSQGTRPIAIAPGAATRTGPVAVEGTAEVGTTGELPKAPAAAAKPSPIAKPSPNPIPNPNPIPKPIPKPNPIPNPIGKPTPSATPPSSVGSRPPTPRPIPVPPQKPPPGMSDADVNALYAKYVQANQAIGKPVGPEGRQKLLKTINAQAPKIMEQYKAKGVDFAVVVKDNQVILRAKPKT